ncbi:MAG: hypothetical protein ACE5JI_09205 [Acidobacteriota bacterium]
MELQRGSQRLHFDPHLVEECVLLAVEAAASSDRRQFHRERDPIYEVDIAETREASFRELNARWSRHFRLAGPLVDALREHPSLEQEIARCLIVRARSAKEEGADLHDNREETRGDSRPVLVIRLRPQTLLHRSSLLALLRHELMYVADMLDPTFGYEPDSASADGGPTHDHLLRTRYRVLWDATIDGRLVARGKLSPRAEKKCQEEFFALFPMLSSNGQRHFERFFRGPRPTHRELLAFAVRPGDGGTTGSAADNRCPLCRLPTTRFHPAPESLGTEVLAAVRADFPQWDPRSGLCLQCADLFEADVDARRRQN